MNGTKTSPKGGAATLTPPIAKKTSAVTAGQDSISQRAAVDMKGAVKAAIACIEGFFPEAKDILLEEVALTQGSYVANAPGSTPGSPTFIDDFLWRVVISFKSGKPGTLSEIMGGDPRLFREVYIDRENGEIRSMGTWGR
jgi:hypothetical protein